MRASWNRRAAAPCFVEPLVLPPVVRLFLSRLLTTPSFTPPCLPQRTLEERSAKLGVAEERCYALEHEVEGLTLRLAAAGASALRRSVCGDGGGNAGSAATARQRGTGQGRRASWRAAASACISLPVMFGLGRAERWDENLWGGKAACTPS